MSGDDWDKNAQGDLLVVAVTGYSVASAPGVGVALRLEHKVGAVQRIMSPDQALELAAVSWLSPRCR